MRYLGIDYGTKRVGIAVSDEAGEFALPLTVLQNDGVLLAAIEKIIAEKKIETIILGESKNFKGQPNKIMGAIKRFKDMVEKETGLPVFYELEFFTSSEAERMKTPTVGRNRKSGLRFRRPEAKNKMLDASAAALILKSFLDKRKPT